MSRANGRFAKLALLQRLTELESRRDIEAARAEADRCDQAARDLGHRLDEADRGHAEAHAAPRLCLSRLAVTASIVTASEEALRQGNAASAAARSTEAAACGACLQSRYRREWFVERDRDERRRDDARRADRADADALLRRLDQVREG